MMDDRRDTMTTAGAGASDAEDPGPEVDAADILVRDLTVRAGGRTLLETASATFPARKVTLIVGPSGAGKTVLLRLLAGLVSPNDGGIAVEGTVSLGAGAPSVGIVFQNYALFDELGALGNVLFGMDHRPRDSVRVVARAAAARELLDELGVPVDTPVALLSGGQRQRLAIARTLAFDPDVIVFDEPTSGLDPHTAERVAERIRRTHERYGKTTIVVTHDWSTLAPIADRVVLFDVANRALVELPRDGLDRAVLEPPPRAELAPRAPRPSLPRRLASALGDALERTCGAAEAAVASSLRVVPAWRSARWGLRFLAHYLSLVASPSSFAYFGAAGLIAGFVATHFTFKFLPFKAYTEPLITEELLHGLGFSLYRIIVPVLLTVLLAARCGAAIAADVGGRVYGHQVDAMRSLRAPPSTYLLTNVLWAFALATPVLVAFGFLVARLTSLAVFAYDYPEHGALFWDGHFHRELRMPGQLVWLGTGWTLVKVLACALGTGTIAYHVGLRPKQSGVDVSRGITTTIIWATLWVLVVHFAFAFFEF